MFCINWPYYADIVIRFLSTLSLQILDFFIICVIESGESINSRRRFLS